MTRLAIGTGRRGYTLLEIVLALLFVSVVLIGLYNIVGAMMNFSVESARKGSVANGTSASLTIMTKEVEDSDVLYFPDAAAAPTTTAMMGCSNWSTIANGPAGPGSGGPLNAAAPVSWFYYCWDQSAPVYVLRRLSASGLGVVCPGAGAAPAAWSAQCSAAGKLGAAGTQTNDVIASDVNLIPGGPAYLFGSVGGNTIGVTMMIGDPNPWHDPLAPGVSGTSSSQRIVNPQTITVNTTINLNRPL
jgi:hypothetical protein